MVSVGGRGITRKAGRVAGGDESGEIQDQTTSKNKSICNALSNSKRDF